MRKYRIGILILGLITVGLAIYVIGLGAQGKQDKATFKSAQKVASSLNAYIASNQKIPETLSQAGVNDAASTITYQKISNEQYKFCANYKTDKGYGGYDVTSPLTSAAFGSYPSYQEDYQYDGSSYKPSSLYISYTYTKGDNCQVIEPIFKKTTNTDYLDSFCSTEELRQRYTYLCETDTIGTQEN